MSVRGGTHRVDGTATLVLLALGLLAPAGALGRAPAGAAAPAPRPVTPAERSPATADADDPDDDGSQDAPGDGDAQSRDLVAASAFDLPPAARDDPYGPRPAGVPVLTLEQINRFALQNPLVRASDEQVAAMRARARKAQFAWVPIIDTTTMLSPGANIKCDDVVLQTADASMQDFQFCHPGGDPNLDIQSARDYFKQLGRAGVRFAFQLDTVIPLYTFGKIRNVRKAAQVGVELTKLQRAATEQETLLRVQQAHTTLHLARESIAILREAKSIVDRAHVRVDKDLGSSEDFDADPGDVNPDRDPDDLMKVRMAALELEELMREARKVESLALSALWSLAGAAAPKGFDAAPTALAPVALDGGRQRLSHYKELAATHRPEAKMAAAGVQLRKAQERLARSNFLPDLGIALSVGIARTSAADSGMSTLYYLDNYNFSRVTAALALRWRFDFHNDAFDLLAARADLRAAEHQREAARLLLGRDVEEAYADLVDAETTVEIRQLGAKEAWKLVVSQEQKDTIGGGNSGELLRALEKWYKWRFAHVEAVGHHNIAAARLARAVGTPLWAASPPNPKNPR